MILRFITIWFYYMWNSKKCQNWAFSTVSLCIRHFEDDLEGCDIKFKGLNCQAMYWPVLRFCQIEYRPGHVILKPDLSTISSKWISAIPKSYLKKNTFITPMELWLHNPMRILYKRKSQIRSCRTCFISAISARRSRIPSTLWAR